MSWVSVNPEKFVNEQKEQIQGVSVRVSISPYDLPQAVRGFRDGNDFVIEFKYVAEERLKTVKLNTHVNLQIGSSTDRLHQIRIDVVNTNTKAVRLEVLEAVEKTFRKLLPRKSPRSRNYRVAEQIISDHSAELLENAAT